MDVRNWLGAAMAAGLVSCIVSGDIPRSDPTAKDDTRLGPASPPPAWQTAFEKELRGLVDLAKEEIAPTFADDSLQEIHIVGYRAEIRTSDEVRSIVYDVMLRQNDGYMVAEGEVEQPVPFDGALHHDYDEYLPRSAVETALPSTLSTLGAGPWEAMIYGFSNGSDTGEHGTVIYSLTDNVIVFLGYYQTV